MSQKLSLRQTRMHTQAPMIGNSVDEQGDLVINKIDAQHAKLFEDRNVMLTDGGIITFTGTTALFTDSLKLSLNSKIDGSVQVFDLGATTRAFSATGRMLYAVINRTAGTVVVTADATALPTVVAANQEVFLIAKRVDATGGIPRLYFRNGSGYTIGASARLGASGSGSGTGTGGGELIDLMYNAQITDPFERIPDGNTTIDIATGKTDAALFDAGKNLFRINYDASKTVTGTATAMTLSGAPGFTVKAGDMLIVGVESKRITAISSQTAYTIESAFTSNPSAAAANVSQAIHTSDLNAFTAGATGLSSGSQYTGSIDEIMVGYDDSTTSGDIIPDFGVASVIAFSASSDGTNFTAPKNRVTSLSNQELAVTCPTSSTQLLMRFFSNATSGTGAVNLLGYKVFFQKMVGSSIGAAYLTAFARPTSAISNNVTHSVVSGKSRFTFTFAYPRGLNSTEPSGSALWVFANGQRAPRNTSGVTDSTQLSFTEITESVIEMDTDYSLAGIDFQFMVPRNIIDSNSINTTKIALHDDLLDQNLDAQIVPTFLSAVNGAAVAGTSFRSDITGRASIPDLSNILSVQMGPQRMMTQEVYQLQNEFGPAGQPVFGAVNDKFNQVRFVGSWSSQTSNNGPLVFTSTVNDYVEIIFYGTGLNLVGYLDNGSTSVLASIDGGSEGTNILVTTVSASMLNGRNYASNIIRPVATGLSLGLHTIKLRLSAVGGFSFVSFGFEVLTETTSLRVAPGTVVKGKYKNVLSSLQTVAYDSVFESGTIGTKGGCVLVYLKSDGTVAKAVTPTDVTPLYLTNASHANEEIIRTHHWREFGAGRSDDFSSVNSTSSSRAFTLDDGTTTLVGNSLKADGAFGGDTLRTTGISNFYSITFIGTGLDLVLSTDSTARSATVSVDGNSAGTLTPTISLINTTYKICSGLPYGTHTVKLTNASAVADTFGLVSFAVYAPKKPSLPIGSIELAQYYRMANDSVSSTVGVPSNGVVRKLSCREAVYVGAWNISLDTSFYSGINVNTSTAASYTEYSFFGTGIEHLCFIGGSNVVNHTYSIDGSSVLSGYITQVIAPTIGSVTLNTATGLLSGTPGATAGQGARVCITGLTFGWHKIRITYNGNYNIHSDGFDVHCPIHAPAINGPYVVQNTLSLGNNNFLDLRKFNKRDIVLSNQGRASQAFGVTSAPASTSTTGVPFADMSVTHFSSTGKIRINYSASLNSSVATNVYCQIYVNGIGKTIKTAVCSTVGYDVDLADFIVVNTYIGVIKIDVYFYNNSGTVSGRANYRNLTVEDI